MKKRHIIAVVIIILLAVVGISAFMIQWEEDKNINGTYYSESSELIIKISEGKVYITEQKEKYLYDFLFSKFSENVSEEYIGTYLKTIISNLEQGVEYVDRSERLVFWPIEGDWINFSIYRMENGTITLFNKTYTKK